MSPEVRVMTTLKVDVTAEDIAKGARRKCESCPVARALGRALKLAPTDFLAANSDHLSWVASGNIGSVATPAIARDFIRRFDRDASVADLQPFSFELEIPEVPK